MIIRTLVLLFGCTMFLSCDTIQEMSDLQGEYNKISEEVFSESAELGWRFENGKMVFLEIMSPAKSLSDFRVQEIEVNVNHILDEILDDRPSIVKLTFVLEEPEEARPVAEDDAPR